MRTTALILLGTALAASGALEAQQVDTLEARVWLDRGDEPVVQRGDEVRVYYRTNLDAYVAIFRIDTDGRISLIFPQHPEMETAVRGGRDYRLLFPRSARWRVQEDPGVGYFFMVASPEPLDFSQLGWDDDRGWDLGEVGATVYEDPYVAIDDYVAAIVPDWDVVPYALDFLTYNVGDTHEYPRFLCYDCHGYQSYSSWNPYRDYCSTYRVVIWDDPYFYPRYRYVGTRVVFGRPFGPRPRYGVARVVVGGGRAPLVRSRAAPPRRTVTYKESPTAARYEPRNPRRAPSRVTPTPTRSARPNALPNRTEPQRRGAVGGRSATPSTTRQPTARPSAPATGSTRAVAPPRRGASEARPTLQRRPSPSARLPARAPTTSRGTPPRASRGSGAATRRPTATPSRGSARPPVRATPQRPPPRATPRSGATSRRPAATRPSRPPPRATPTRQPTTRSRPSATRRPTAGSSGTRRPTRRPPPRRPGGGGG